MLLFKAFKTNPYLAAKQNSPSNCSMFAFKERMKSAESKEKLIFLELFTSVCMLLIVSELQIFFYMGKKKGGI